MASDTPQRRIPAICIGHSHSGNLAEAAQAEGVGLEILNFWALPGAVVTQTEGVSLTPSLVERLGGPQSQMPVFSLIGGAVHHDIGLVLHPEPYDFVDPADRAAPLVPGATMIPFHAIVAALRARVAPYLALMDAVRRACGGPMFHMQSPPIFAGEQLVGQDEAYWLAYHGQRLPIAPAFFRKKLWRLHSAIVAGHCGQAGIIFVPCPAQAIDAAGYLRAGLNAHAAHANAAYGALVLRQIEALALPMAAPSGTPPSTIPSNKA